jgi:hypothetical protein
LGYKTYFIFATFNYAASIHFFFMYPETAGRTLEEIEAVFEAGNTFTAWRISRDVGKKSLAQVEHELAQAGDKPAVEYLDEKGGDESPRV